MTTRHDIESDVRDRFGGLARDPNAPMPFPVGASSARALGYDPARLDVMPSCVSDAFAGVGNPLGIAPPLPGETLLDLGCGAGLDSIIASRYVGPRGRVIGVDFTDAMVARARNNAQQVGATHIEFLTAGLDALPLPTESVDRVISNGVFNLCFDKPRVLNEASRVLRPGGRLQMADILLEDHVSPEDLARMGEWSA